MNDDNMKKRGRGGIVNLVLNSSELFLVAVYLYLKKMCKCNIEHINRDWPLIFRGFCLELKVRC